MRDITDKIKTLRIATAQAVLIASPETLRAIREQTVPKGDPLPVAKVAAIQAAKNCSQIIPYCHPLPIDYVGVDFDLREDRIEVRATVKTIYKTGVEMEALTAASVAVLTLYDMLKMLDEQMEIGTVRLLSKRGGKSDFRNKTTDSTLPFKAAVVVLSDTVSSGENEDISGRLLVERIEQEGLQVTDYQVIPDEPEQLKALLSDYADRQKLDLVITTGGTGFSHRDTTPEALQSMIDREIPGIAEALRNYGQERTPYAMLSRGICGQRGDTLIISLPGSKNAVRESLDVLFPYITHAFGVLHGERHEQGHRRKQEAISTT